MEPLPDSMTIPRMFAECVHKYAALPALHEKSGGAWKTTTFGELGDMMRRFSKGLAALGIAPGDRVAVLSENRVEWVVADLAALAAGAVTVPIYPTLPPVQVEHILADSGAKAIVLSDSKQLAKIADARERCPNLTLIVMMDHDGADITIHTPAAVMGHGDTPGDDAFEARRDSVKPADLASLVYTSGTTGDPKGAMLTHGNFASAIHAAIGGIPLISPGERFLSFLPLCHVYERVTYYISITQGGNTYYAESLFKVQENMAEIKPTVVQTVPRLLEVMHERIVDAAAKLPDDRRKGFNDALKIGADVWAKKNAGQPLGIALSAKHAIADKLALSQVRERLGGKLRFFVSGGAPLRREPAEFFNAIGIPVLEGYGLTETTAACTVNPLARTKVGTVGRPFPGIDVKLAPDGEILIAGPNIMRGYWNHPEATAETIDSDGWLHSGDIGTIDAEGYLTITDRKKDILVLANGKNVAPQPIEGVLRAAKLVSDIVLLGDHSGTVGAMVVPDFAGLAEWAKAQGIAFEQPAELASNADARREIKRNIDALSGNLAEFEKVRKIALLDHAFSVENGELTPTLKVKRKVVRERYGHLLD